jgi:four helix bundle protein
VNFEDWEARVPQEIRNDSLWKMHVYRLGLFLFDLAWIDAAKVLKDVRSASLADQLCRAVSRISSNVAEGYSRGTAKARVTYYEYALGSTREARDWYYKGRHVLKDKVTNHRIKLCTDIVKLLIRTIDNEQQKNRRLARAPVNQ